MRLIKVVFITLSTIFEVILNPNGEMARAVLGNEEEDKSPADLP